MFWTMARSHASPWTITSLTVVPTSSIDPSTTHAHQIYSWCDCLTIADWTWWLTMRYLLHLCLVPLVCRNCMLLISAVAPRWGMCCGASSRNISDIANSTWILSIVFSSPSLSPMSINYCLFSIHSPLSISLCWLARILMLVAIGLVFGILWHSSRRNSVVRILPIVVSCLFSMTVVARTMLSSLSPIN